MRLTPMDLNNIRQLLREELKPVKLEIAEVKAEVAEVKAEHGKLIAENMRETGGLKRVVQDLVTEVREIRADMRDDADRPEPERLKAPTGLRVDYS